MKRVKSKEAAICQRKKGVMIAEWNRSSVKMKTCRSLSQTRGKVKRVERVTLFTQSGLEWVGLQDVGEHSADTQQGSRGSKAIFRVQLLTVYTRQLTSYLDHPSNPRETFHGRLRSEAYQSQRRYGHHRPTEKDARRLFEQMPKDARSPRGWRLVEISRPKC